MRFRLVPAAAAAVFALITVVPGYSANQRFGAATLGRSSSKVLYQTAWKGGVSGWARGGGRWTVRSGILSYSGDDVSALVVPYRLNRRNYSVEASIRLVTWKDTGISESHGFGILVRAKPGVDPSGDTAGLMAGIGRGFLGCDGVYSQSVVATADTDLTSLRTQNKAFLPKHTWHLYRADVRGDTITLSIDGRVVNTVTTKQFAASVGIGLFSLSTQLDVKDFRVLDL
jgi:hypothetical protein